MTKSAAFDEHNVPELTDTPAKLNVAILKGKNNM